MSAEEVELGGVGEMSSRLLDGSPREESEAGMESLDYEVVESAVSRRRQAQAGGAGRTQEHLGPPIMPRSHMIPSVRIRDGRWRHGSSTTSDTSP